MLPLKNRDDKPIPYPKFDTVQELANSLNYDYISQLGCGAFGCAYSVVDRETDQLRVLKVTTDSSENNCMFDIAAMDGWERTIHLPRIDVFGKSPVRIADFGYKHRYYYIREELASIPKEFWSPQGIKSYARWAWSLTKEAREAIKEIRAKTDLCLPDPHMENWGFRATELEKFVRGKTTNIPTYVLRDISCTECKLSDSKYDESSPFGNYD